MYVRPCDYQCLWGKVLMKLEGKCNVVCALYSCRLLSECTLFAIFVASANLESWHLMSSSMSFIYTRSKELILPKTDPWGTPLLTLIQSEDLPLISTRCLRFDGQSSIHAAMSPVKPCALTLLVRCLCETLSKAFWTSKYIVSTALVLLSLT